MLKQGFYSRDAAKDGINNNYTADYFGFQADNRYLAVVGFSI